KSSLSEDIQPPVVCEFSKPINLLQEQSTTVGDRLSVFSKQVTDKPHFYQSIHQNSHLKLVSNKSK
ncbi:MAG: hypothetical protein FWE73_03020, partial [Candidatus Bathyarchaeota archaeon]|nr:hypothetical protein [Candidatus Termitimicrobium sp.]